MISIFESVLIFKCLIVNVMVLPLPSIQGIQTRVFQLFGCRLTSEIAANGFHRFFIAFSSLFHRFFIAFSSLFHRLFIAFSSLFHRFFIAFSSLFHRFFIAFSLLFHCFFIAFSLLFHRFFIAFSSCFVGVTLKEFSKASAQIGDPKHKSSFEKLAPPRTTVKSLLNRLRAMKRLLVG
jgi:hypothetical protein